MTEAREAEVLRAISTLGTADEAVGFRHQIAAQGEQMTGTVMAALVARIDVLARREGRVGA